MGIRRRIKSEKQKPPGFTGLVSQEDSEVAIFETDILRADGATVKANLVADSGAFMNYVNSSYAETLGYQIQKVSVPAGTGANGGKIFTDRARDVPVKFDDQCIRKGRFYLLENLPQTFIVGRPTLKRWGVLMDLELGTLHLKGDNITLTLKGGSDLVLFIESAVDVGPTLMVDERAAKLDSFLEPYVGEIFEYDWAFKINRGRHSIERKIKR